MNNIYKRSFFLFLTIFFSCTSAWSQVNYNDGPIRLRVWVHKVWSSANCADLGDQEYVIKDIRARVSNTSGGFITSPSGLNLSFWGNENRYYDMGQLHSANIPGGVFLDPNGYKVLDVSYPGTQVPSQFDVYIGSAFENDCYGDVLSCGQGSEASYEGCCCLFGVCALSDDYLYTGTGWTPVNFRPGPQGQVNYTQPVVYNGSGDEHAYSVVYAYEWDWTGNVKTLCASPNYQDGPITLTADLVGVFADVDWDGGTCGISFGGNEDLRLKLLAKDNLTPSFGNFPVGSSMHLSQDVPKWNGVFSNQLTKNYTTADINMQSFDVAADLWEEDSYDYGSVFGFGINCGSDNDYEGSDYAFPWLCINGDDAHFVSRTGAPGNPVYTIPTYGAINWRSSPPNTFNTVDIPARIGSGSYQNWILRYRYKWTISTPTVSIPTTDLEGCIGGASIPLTATTINATYFKWQYADATSAAAGTCPVGANWTDVPGEYCKSINFPQVAGTRVYRCIVYNRNGAGSTTSSGEKYDSAVSNCVRVTYFPYAPPIVSTACGRSVPSGGAIAFSVPSPPAPNAGLPGWTYSWTITPTTNVAPTSGSGTTFNPVFTSAAAGTTYTVRVTVIDACPGADAFSTCTFNVTTPSCDQIYVAPPANGGNDANPGTSSSPYATIGNALANIGGNRVHIHIMGGATYSNETQWLIPTNAIIDGGWEIISLANNDWRKNSSLTTTVNLNPGPENDGTQGYYRGIVSTGNNWLMQDLTINVKNGANQPNVTTTRFNNKGYTIYGIYSNNTNGWEIKRTSISTGNGTNGAPGTTPAGSGGGGGGGTGGGGGGSGSLADCYGGGPSNCPGGGCQGQATDGGGGGSGAANNGSAGSGGGGGSWQTGGDCNLVGCGADGNNGISGGGGGNGGTGNPNYGAGNPAAPGVSTPFYQPAGVSASGGIGGGGGKGGGGGGGDVGTCCLSCPFSGCGWSRPNGGTGGDGGGGGLGGGGGYGAGGSFGGYFVNGTGGAINQSSILAGAGGTGGSGANGQPGGTGINGSGGIYSGGCDGNGQGGNGGRGGDGGSGGRGQDGANGLSQNIVSIASAITQNGGTPNGPNAAIDYLKARYLKGCTNSYIEIEKAAGAAASPGFDTTAMAASVINDQSPNTTSYSYTTAGFLNTFVQFYTPGWKQEKLLTQNGWTTFIRILEVRSVPKITTAPKRVCSGENVSFTITSNNPNQDYSNTAADYEWRYRIYKDGVTRRAPVPAWSATSNGSGPNTFNIANNTCDSITVLIASRVRDKCCGWSIWVYDSIVVFPSITPANTWTAVPASGTNVCLKGAPATLSVNIPTGQTGGITCGAGAAYFIYRYSTDGGVSWTAWSSTRPTAIPKIIGTTLVESAYVSPLSGDNCDTATSSLNINWTINDSVQASAGVIDVAACGTPNSSAIISAASPAIGSGQWTQVSGASNSTPATPTSTLVLTINNVPFNTTDNVYRWTVTNGACVDQVDVTISTPTIVGNAITMQSDACYVCPIADGQTYSFYDYTGKIIMTIKDNSPPTSALGSTEVCTHIHPYVQQTWTVALPDSQPYLQRYWTISPAANTDATVTLYFTSAEYNALKLKAMTGAYAFSGLSDLRVSKFPGGGGGAFTPIHSPGGIMMPGLGTGLPDPVWATWAGNGTDYQVTFDCNSYSTFYIHPVAYPYEVLPVELVSFTGTNIGDKNWLQWITASEHNTDKFIVEKSLDIANWFYVGEKPAAGNSTQRLTYELFDNFPVTGNNYYRLKTIDKDGTFKYSQIINIPITATNTTGIVGAYPNPTSGDIVLVISANANQTGLVKVYDMLGKVVKTTNVDLVQGINKPQIDISSLANATYIVVLTDKKGYEYKYKIVKE